LFERLALSKDKKGIMALAKRGHRISKADDVFKDPYVFEFIGMPHEKRVSERGLQKRLTTNLQKLVMELGKGFSFVGQDYKLTIDNTHYFVDLVFYHRILKCHVLIDLKTRKVRHQDIGQMNLYLNYFNHEESSEGDNPAIGIIIAADKNELLVKYAMGGLSNKIFVSKYQLYLPSQKVLEQKMRELMRNL
jgi:predicted nuclease of restriction endonuclease-like (RecB) superfamily